MTDTRGAFGSELSIRATTATTWALTEDLVWTGTKGDTFTVPAGFETDFATIPRFLHWLVLPYGPYTRAAVLHDWLIVERINHPDPLLRVPSRDVDGMFRRVMEDLAVSWPLRWAMWAAVRAASLFSPGRARGRGFALDAPKVFGVAVVAVPLILPGVVGVLLSLGFVRVLSWIGMLGNGGAQ